MSRSFHVVVHPKPIASEPISSVTLDGTALTPLKLDLTTVRFTHSFEQVAEGFDQLPRMYLEPDGSFVWVAKNDVIQHQLDGVLTDDGERLIHIELKGTCDSATLDTLLDALGWPQQSVVFQLVQQGWYIDESDFRRLFCDDRL